MVPCRRAQPSSTASGTTPQRRENALRTRCAVGRVVLGEFGRCSGERWHRTSQREHRDQPAVVPRTRCGAGLPGLLRSERGREPVLLRWPVLGVPEGYLVREFLVQRALAGDRPRGRAVVHPENTRALLPPSACLLVRVAVRCAATLGPALGP